MSDDTSQDALLKEVQELRLEVSELKRLKRSEKRLQKKVADLKAKNKRDTEYIRDLTSKCKHLEGYLEAGNISTIPMLVDEYIGFSKPRLLRIGTNYHIEIFDNEVREKIDELVLFLNSAASEFQKISSDFSINYPNRNFIKQAKSKIRTIKTLLKRLKLGMLNENQINLISKQFDDFINCLYSIHGNDVMQNK